MQGQAHYSSSLCVLGPPYVKTIYQAGPRTVKRTPLALPHTKGLVRVGFRLVLNNARDTPDTEKVYTHPKSPKGVLNTSLVGLRQVLSTNP